MLSQQELIAPENQMKTPCATEHGVFVYAAGSSAALSFEILSTSTFPGNRQQWLPSLVDTRLLQTALEATDQSRPAFLQAKDVSDWRGTVQAVAAGWCAFQALLGFRATATSSARLRSSSAVSQGS